MLSRLMPPKLNQVKPSGHVEHGGAEYIGDDMEHDQDIDGGYAPLSEDDAVVGESSLVIDMEIDVASSEVRKDVEFNSSHGGGSFHHILGSFLPHSRNSKREKGHSDWRHELAGKAS
nr:E3 ubiquitin-protein ligase UPL2-like [Tanacetum cinerariifolium]